MSEGTPRFDSFPRQALLAALAAITLTGARFAASAIAARRLSQADFGQFAYVMWLVDIAFLVCSLGATGAVGRYAAEFRSDPEQLAAFMHRWRRWAAGLPLLAGLAAVLGVWLSGMPHDSASLTLVALWAAVQGRWAMQTAALTGGQRFDAILRANVLAGVVMLSGMVLLPLGASGLPLVFALMATSGCVGALTGTSHVRQLGTGAIATLSPETWRSIRRYAANIWLTAMLWAFVWSRGEFPIVRLYLGDEGVAAYAAAMTLFGGAVQAVMLGVSGVAPQLTRLWGEGRAQEALETARRVMAMQLAACGVAALALICFGSEVITMAFGERYRDGSGVLVVLSVGLVSLTLSTQNHILQIATDARFNRNTSLLGLVALMLLAFALTPSLGIEGAALARASTMGLLAVISVIVARRHWGGGAVALDALVVTWILCGVVGLAAYAIGDQLIGVRITAFLLGLTTLTATLRRNDGVPIVAGAVRCLASALSGFASKQSTRYRRREH